MSRDPGPPEDPGHDPSPSLDDVLGPWSPYQPTGGLGPAVPHPSRPPRPTRGHHDDVPVVDWCFAWPLSLGRAAPGARRVRWNGRIVTGEPTTDGPGALWTTSFTAHLRPEPAFPVRTQAGVSRLGIRRSGGVTGGGIVIVPRDQLLGVAEYADALLNQAGAGGDRPTRGLSEWSLALVGTVTGTRFGIRLEYFEGRPGSAAARRRFADVVDADWIVEVGAADEAGVVNADRLAVRFEHGGTCFEWDHGETHLAIPAEVEPKLDPADVRTLHDVVAFIAARRASTLPWIPSATPPGW